MNPRPQGVVFDFGNVLYRVDYPAMARELAGDRASEFLSSFVGSRLQVEHESGLIGLPDVLRGLRAAGFPVPRRRFLDAYLAVFTPIPGTRALVERLAERRPLGLLSNTSPEHARGFIETTPEFRCFRARVYSFELGCLKPDLRTYRAAARRLGLPPEDLVYTDDLEPLARASSSAGMRGVPFRGAADLSRSLAGLGFSELDPPRA